MTKLVNAAEFRVLGRVSAVLCAAIGMTLAANAGAADTLFVGNAVIGKHPNGDTNWAAFYRTGMTNPSLMVDGLNAYLGAGLSTGQVIFRGNTTIFATMGKDGLNIANTRFTNSNIAVGTPSTAQFDALARIGTHPTYGKTYAAFWLDLPNCSNCAARDYTLLADSENTFLNSNHATRGKIYFRTNNIDRMILDPGVGLVLKMGIAQKDGGGAWTATSDVRVKQDIADYVPGLAELEQVRPVTYRYNGLAGMADTKTKFVGVIAQELEKVLPSMVSTSSKKLREDDKSPTEIKQVDPSAFTYTLINAVKELAEENRAMKRVLCKDHPSEAFCRSPATLGSK